jgi:hypothetical protein
MSQSMKYKTEIMEMARIACASIHDDLQEQMDISDDLFVEIRDYIQEEMKQVTPEALTESVLEDMSIEFLEDGE